MDGPPIYPLPRERNLVLAALLVTAAAAWALLWWQSSTMSAALPMDQPASMGDDTTMAQPAAADAGMTAEPAMAATSPADRPASMGLTMGMAAPLFLAMWIAMMVAMMFPTAAPMILTFTRVHAGRRAKGQAFVPTWVFVAGYLVVWTLFGVAAYAVATGAQALAPSLPWLADNAARIGGAAIVLAGLYQFSPLKQVCLTRCRGPLEFILGCWRDGYRGALRMGVEHGTYCLGCCWLLFVILFPLGIMNVAAMALITALIFAEKSLRGGRLIGRFAAAALVAYGLLVVFLPGALPTTMG